MTYHSLLFCCFLLLFLKACLIDVILVSSKIMNRNLFSARGLSTVLSRSRLPLFDGFRWVFHERRHDKYVCKRNNKSQTCGCRAAGGHSHHKARLLVPRGGYFGHTLQSRTICRRLHRDPRMFRIYNVNNMVPYHMVPYCTIHAHDQSYSYSQQML